MKKYLCILILALCASLLPVSPALADTVSWVRITQDNTRFYRNPTNMDADIMFELEKSYYLKVVSEQSYFYQVELMDNGNGFVKIYGYVKKTDVTPCDTVPELPLYPAVYISVTGSNAILYSACSTASQPLCSVFYGQQLNYYGSMTVANSKWYFVKTGETFAYINSAYASAPLINPHPTPLPGEETPEPEPGRTEYRFRKDRAAVAVLRHADCFDYPHLHTRGNNCGNPLHSHPFKAQKRGFRAVQKRNGCGKSARARTKREKGAAALFRRLSVKIFFFKAVFKPLFSFPPKPSLQAA